MRACYRPAHASDRSSQPKSDSRDSTELLEAFYDTSECIFVAAHKGTDWDPDEGRLKVSVGGLIHGRPICDCCGDEVGAHPGRGPLMQLADGSQRYAKLDNKCGSKHKKEVKAGREKQCTIEWLREWRGGL